MTQKKRLGKGLAGRWRCILLAGILMFPRLICAQSVSASGGTSSFLNVSGFRFDYNWLPVYGWAGFGFKQGVHLGGFLGTTYHGYHLGIGDRYLPVAFDTDVFGPAPYFDARGLSVLRQSDRQRWMAFAGTTATELATPFLRSFTTGETTGAFFYERKFRPRAVFHSWNILRGEWTSIQSVGINLKPTWNVSAAAGVGSGSPYGAIATEYKHTWLDAAASYTDTSNHFQRIRITTPSFPERIGTNARLRLSPWSNVNVQLDHENLLTPAFGKESPVRASLDGANISAFIKKFGLSGGLTTSRAGPLETQTGMVSVQRRLGSPLTAYGSIVRFSGTANKPQNLYVLTSEERLSPRLSLRQTVTQSAGHTSMGWGGDFLSNRITLGVDYETEFTPMAGGFGLSGRQFTQAWMVNVGLSLPHGLRFHYDNFFDPFGRVRYTAYVSGVSYAREGALPVGGAPLSVRLARYLVRGVVQDEKGQPVWGIAIHLDGQTVYSNTMGQFFLRLKNRGPYPLTVLPAQSLNPWGWQLVRAPASTMAESENTAHQVVVVVRRRLRGDGGRPGASIKARHPKR